MQHVWCDDGVVKSAACLFFVQASLFCLHFRLASFQLCPAKKISRAIELDDRSALWVNIWLGLGIFLGNVTALDCQIAGKEHIESD